MYKFSLSVRAYHIGRKYGFPCFEDWGRLPSEVMRAACLNAAMDIIVDGRGRKTAIELLRAGGLGIYQISLIIDGDVDRVRWLCERFDKTLHEGLD